MTPPKTSVGNRTDQAVDQLLKMMHNQSFYPPVDEKLKAIAAKYKRMEEALTEILHGSIKNGKWVLMDKTTCKEVATEALSFDPLSLSDDE